MPSKRSLKIDLRRAATLRPSTQQGPQQLATPSSQLGTLSHKRKAAVEASNPPPARRKAKVKAKVKAEAKASASTPRALGPPSAANQPIHISSDTEGLDKGGSGLALGSSPPPSPPPPPSRLPTMSLASAAIRRQFALLDSLEADSNLEDERQEDNNEEEDEEDKEEEQPMLESIHFSCTFKAIYGKESVECGTDAFDTENTFAL